MIVCAPEFIVSPLMGATRSKKEELVVSRGVEDLACSSKSPGKVRFLIPLARVVPVGSGSFGGPSRVSISFTDTAHIGITAAAEQGSSPSEERMPTPQRSGDQQKFATEE